MPTVPDDGKKFINLSGEKIDNPDGTTGPLSSAPQASTSSQSSPASPFAQQPQQEPQQKQPEDPWRYLHLSPSATDTEKYYAANRLSLIINGIDSYDGSEYNHAHTGTPLSADDYYGRMVKAASDGMKSLVDQDVIEWDSIPGDDTAKKAKYARERLGMFQRAKLAIGGTTEKMVDLVQKKAADLFTGAIFEPSMGSAYLSDEEMKEAPGDVVAANKRLSMADIGRASMPEDDRKKALESIENWRQEKEDKRAIAIYESEINAKYVWRQYSAIKPLLKPESDALLQKFFRDDNTSKNWFFQETPEWVEQFKRLPFDQQQLVAMVGSNAKNRRDRNLVRDAAGAFLDMAADVPKDFVKKSFVETYLRSTMDDAEYQKYAETSALLSNVLKPRLAEYGYWGQSAIALAATIPYMGYAGGVPKSIANRVSKNAVARFGMRNVGTAMIAAKAAHDFEARVAAEGGNVTSMESQLFGWTAGLAYAAIEKFQMSTAFKGWTDLEMRQAYTGMMGTIIHPILTFGTDKGRKALTHFAIPTATKGAFRTFGYELSQEMAQKAVEDGYVAWGLERPIARSMAEGAFQEMKDAAGVMGLLAIGGVVGGGTVGNFSTEYTTQEHIDAIHHAQMALNAWNKRADPKAKKELERQRIILGGLQKTWLAAGTDANAAEQFRRRGLPDETAKKMATFFRNQYRSIMEDKTLSEKDKERLVGKELPASNIIQQLLPNNRVEDISVDRPDGTKDSVIRIHGTTGDAQSYVDIRRAEIPLDPDSMSKPNVAASIVEAIRQRDPKNAMTVKEWMDLPRERKVELAEQYRLRNSGFFEMVTKDGAVLDENGIKTLIGSITISPSARVSTSFHEYFHWFMKANRSIGIISNEDMAALREQYGEPSEGVDEAFNEERAADHFRDVAAGKVNFVKRDPLQKAWDWLMSLNVSITEKKREEEAKKSTDELTTSQIISGKWIPGKLVGAKADTTIWEPTPAAPVDAVPAADAPPQEDTKVRESNATPASHLWSESYDGATVNGDIVAVNPGDIVIPGDAGYRPELAAVAEDVNTLSYRARVKVLADDPATAIGENEVVVGPDLQVVRGADLVAAARMKMAGVGLGTIAESARSGAERLGLTIPAGLESYILVRRIDASTSPEAIVRMATQRQQAAQPEEAPSIPGQLSPDAFDSMFPEEQRQRAAEADAAAFADWQARQRAERQKERRERTEAETRKATRIDRAIDSMDRAIRGVDAAFFDENATLFDSMADAIRENNAGKAEELANIIARKGRNRKKQAARRSGRLDSPSSQPAVVMEPAAQPPRPTQEAETATYQEQSREPAANAPESNVVPKAQKKPKAEKKPIKRPRSFRAPFSFDTAGMTPTIDALVGHVGRIRPKSRAVRPGGEYDGAPSVIELGGFARLIYAGRQSGLYPDDAAQQLFEAGFLSDPDTNLMWESIINEVHSYRKMRDQNKQRDAEYKENAKSASAFDRETGRQDDGEIPVNVSSLKIGDVVEVEGEHLEVVEVDPESGDVTLKDGKKYGVQLVEDGKVLFVDKADILPVDDMFGGDSAFSLESVSPEQLQEENERQNRREMLENLAAKPIVGKPEADFGQGLIAGTGGDVSLFNRLSIDTELADVLSEHADALGIGPQAEALALSASTVNAIDENSPAMSIRDELAAASRFLVEFKLSGWRDMRSFIMSSGLDVPESIVSLAVAMSRDATGRNTEAIIQQYAAAAKGKADGKEEVLRDVARRYEVEADADYMAAVERGDMETAQRIVDEAIARLRKGKRMSHLDGGKVAIVSLMNRHHNLYGNVGSTGNAYLNVNGTVNIDGVDYSPGDILYLDKYDRLVPQLSDSEMSELKKILSPRIDMLVKMSSEIDRTKPRLTNEEEDEARNRTNKKQNDPFMSFFDDNGAGLWRTLRYPTVNPEIQSNYRDYMWVDSLSPTHNPLAIRDAVLQKHIDENLKFIVGGYLHLNPLTEITPTIRMALGEYVSLGGELGKTAIDALGEWNPSNPEYHYRSGDEFPSFREAVIRDDSGRIIPPSERFNPQSNGIRHEMEAEPRAFSGNSEAIAALAVQSLAGKQVTEDDAKKAIYLYLARDLEPAKAIKLANEYANGEIGKAAKKSLAGGYAQQAMQMIAINAEIDAFDIAGVAVGGAQAGAMSGLRLSERSLRDQERAIKRLIMQARGATLRDLEIYSGISLTDTIINIPPPENADGDEYGGKKKDTEQAPGGIEATRDATPEEIADRKERHARLILAAKLKAVELREERRKAEEERLKKAAEGKDTDAGAEEEESESEEEKSPEEPSAIPNELLEAHGVDMNDAEEVAALVRAYVADMMIERSDGRLTEESVWKDIEAVETYRKTLQEQLNELADAMLDPIDTTPGWAHRMVGDLTTGLSADQLESRSVTIFRFINHNAIRQSRKKLVGQIIKDLEEMATSLPKWDPMQEDLERKVSGVSEFSARYIRRVLKMGPTLLAREHERLKTILEERAEAYEGDTARMDMDLAYRMAALQQELLMRWEGLRRKMPSEIVAAREEIRGWIEQEAKALQDRWLKQIWAQQKVLWGLQDGSAPKDRERLRDKDDSIMTRFGESMLATLREELNYLIRHGDPAKRDEAIRSIGEIMNVLYAGTRQYILLKEKYKKQLDEGLIQIMGSRKKATDYLKRMEKEIPESLRRAVFRQGSGKVTWQQALQLYASITQKFYANNVILHKRVNDQKALEDAMTPEDMRVVSLMRQIYENRREEISRVVESVTGMKVYRPDELYMPVQMKIPSKDGLGTFGTVRQWKIFSEGFTPRRHSGLDFDESVGLFDMYYQREEDSARAVAFGERGILIRGILGNKDWHKIIERYYGKRELTRVLSHVTDIMAGVKHKSGWEQTMARKLRHVSTLTTLSMNPMSASKQIASIWMYASVEGMTLGRLLKAMANIDKQTLDEVLAHEGYFARYQGGLSPELRDSLNSLRNSMAGRALSAGMILIKYGDIAPTRLVLPGLYKARVAAIMDQGEQDEAKAKAEALEWAWQQVEETQQSSMDINRNDFYRGGDEVSMLLLQYASAPLLQLSHEVSAYYDMKAGVKGAKERFARIMIINHVLIPAMMGLVSHGWAWALGEPPDERALWKRICYAMLISPFSRVLIAGAILEGLFSNRGGRSSFVPAESIVRPARILIREVVAEDLMTWDMEELVADLYKCAKSALAPVRIAGKAIENRMD